ncbi:MAG: histidinol dehydrogenase [Calditrichae bacterium]|nr:histidinol dehydrogenase [Calditrichia bacterium]
MKIIEYPDISDYPKLLSRPELDNQKVKDSVAEICDYVKSNGDKALFEYSEKFDVTKLQSLAITADEWLLADTIADNLKEAIKAAAVNIRRFHQNQKSDEKPLETMPGVKCWRKSVAIEKVGIYIPGGSAPLFSTVLMLAIPAQLAGCKKIIMVSPPDKNGHLHPAILFAAKEAGVTDVFKSGGAQAIAALAYGTESIPKVDKIFGPGNRYVTYAKQRISTEGIAIDMPAGPSEVAVIADISADPEFVAADLLAQAEHGPDSQVILFSDDKAVLEKCLIATEKQLEKLPRKEIAEKALQNSRFILCKSLDNALDMSNFYAPEHLIINTKNADVLAEKVINAGSVFIGAYTPEAAGDYASGTNHTLPTNGFARAYSGVSLDSYYKKITFQKISEQGLKNLAGTIETMAEAEQLIAHRNSVSIRRIKLNGESE